jgi:hypothetical protein
VIGLDKAKVPLSSEHSCCLQQLCYPLGKSKPVYTAYTVALTGCSRRPPFVSTSTSELTVELAMEIFSVED